MTRYHLFPLALLWAGLVLYGNDTDTDLRRFFLNLTDTVTMISWLQTRGDGLIRRQLMMLLSIRSDETGVLSVCILHGISIVSVVILAL